MKYNGYYQLGDTILEKLSGPMGNGSVEYDNGDFFEGYFHLNFANINGPCYCAKGKYTFADGSFIENAWIQTSKSLAVMDLLGVFKVQKPGQPDRWVSFFRNKKHGYELVLEQEPYAIEWYEGEKVQQVKVDSYQVTENEDGCVKLEMVLPKGFRVELRGGRMSENNYGESYYDTHLEADVYFPDGSSYSCYGWNLKDLQPYDGWVTAHFTNGRLQSQEWKEGQLVSKGEMKYDKAGAKQATLPDPLGGKTSFDCFIWDDYIEYDYHWKYTGDVVDGMPNGKGVFQDDDNHIYSGEFRNGLAHGAGVFTYEPGGVKKDGVWIEGVFQNPEAPTEPIVLHIHWKHSEWSIGGGDDEETKEWDWEAKEGECPFSGFSLKVEEITRKWVVFSDRRSNPKVLTPGGYVNFSSSIDGYEDHEGVTWNGDDYSICISWPEH